MIQKPIYTELTYTTEIKNEIVKSGGTIVFTKDNIILASEISEAQYRELLKNIFIEKIDVLPLKRYGNEGIKYTIDEKSNNIVNDGKGKSTNLKNNN